MTKITLAAGGKASTGGPHDDKAGSDASAPSSAHTDTTSLRVAWRRGLAPDRGTLPTATASV